MRVASEGDARFRSRSVTIPTSFPSSNTGSMLMWLSIIRLMACCIGSVAFYGDRVLTHPLAN